MFAQLVIMSFHMEFAPGHNSNEVATHNMNGSYFVHENQRSFMAVVDLLKGWVCHTFSFHLFPSFS